MKRDIRLAATWAIAALAISLPSKALALENFDVALGKQATDPRVVLNNNIDLNRAKNLARQAGVSANGGLGRYRPENSMHGPATEAPFVDNGDGSWTFTFKGRRPDSSVYNIQTVVTVSKDGRQVNVDYNGPIR
ncbi:hypothetical protein [Aerosakkonema funiforme]|uniref:hypothetical protein n=1 Tax=Aerosakkonema funiforme TaxID=1246630 RepID=UPI0035BAA52B